MLEAYWVGNVKRGKENWTVKISDDTCFTPVKRNGWGFVCRTEQGEGADGDADMTSAEGAESRTGQKEPAATMQI